jgi:hypothetical protein
MQVHANFGVVCTRGVVQYAVAAAAAVCTLLQVGFLGMPAQ